MIVPIEEAMKPDKTNDDVEIRPAEDGLEGAPTTETIIAGDVSGPPPPPPKLSFAERLRQYMAGLNIYLLAFALVLLIAGFTLFITIKQGSNDGRHDNGDIQELTPEALKNLTGDEIRVGDPKSLLSVESNAIFSGSILVRGSLEVAGPLKVGGSLSLPGITVSGISQFDQVQANTLSVAGNASVQGQMNIQQSLTVNGSGTFSGPLSAPSLNIDTLKIGSDLQLNRHVDAGGKSPTASAGAAVGSGGTVSISGSDTAGTVTINVGSGAPAGVLANINFADKFGGIPHVVITPVGSSAAALNYYLSTRTSSGFSIATSNASSSASFSFDYIVID